jgi:hypothetical protein
VAADLRVETAELRSTGELIVEYGATVSSIDGTALAARRSRYGNPALASAADGFAERWARGLRATADDVRTSGTALVSTAGWLEAVDADIADAARDLWTPQ